jgi:hypothetical protein
MATPGTPSGENQSVESQTCGRKISPRAASSSSSWPTRGSSQLPAMCTPRSQMRTSSNCSSGRSGQSVRVTGFERDAACGIWVTSGRL